MAYIHGSRTKDKKFSTRIQLKFLQDRLTAMRTQSENLFVTFFSGGLSVKNLCYTLFNCNVLIVVAVYLSDPYL